jgi:hypothetical protein
MRWAAVTVLLLAGAAGAQTPAASSGADAVTEPCRADMEKLCAGIEPGGGRMKDCLRQHAGQLSPGCRKTLRKLAKAAQENGGMQWVHACRDDIGTMCKGVDPGGGRIVACLQSHADQVSPGCKAALPAP